MLRLHTLGGLSVRAEGRAVSGALGQPRRLAVLAVLARAGERGATREKLLALLWPDADEQRGPRSLAQALYSLRRDLDSDDAISGIKELRLDPSIVASDVRDFEAALAAGALETAADLYAGPFLDGFHLPGAAEFERWVEEERSVLAHLHTGALERLARRDADRGDASAAAGWWRRLAALDPLNARFAVGFMEALAASGDRGGALRHARVYEVLLEQELDLPPDREVVALAERLRREAEAPVEVPRRAPVPDYVDEPSGDRVPTLVAPTLAAPTLVAPIIEAPAYVPPVSAPAPSAPATVALPAAPPSPRRRPWLAVAAATVAIAAAALLWRGRSAPGAISASATAERPVIAVGHIASYRMDNSGADLAAPVADLLATNLARTPELRVVSTARLYELLAASGAASGAARDSSTGAVVAAARRAGATELVDGTLYALPGGRLRLDLRRTLLATGELRAAGRIEGVDVFAIVDSGTARLVAALGVAAPTGSVADVTTRSVVASRLYAEGLARRAVGDGEAAARLFGAALAEDSTFAMAAFRLSQAVSDMSQSQTLLNRALRLSAGATDRERLMIRAGWAFQNSSPTLAAVAETLAVRYPDEVEGHLYRGQAMVAAESYLAAVPYLERVVRMDSAAVLASRPRCGACDALQTLVYVYAAVDSLGAAEREARRWVRLQPRGGLALLALGNILDARDRSAEALAALRAMAVADPGNAQNQVEALAMHHMRVGEYAAAERLLLGRREVVGRNDAASTSWYLAMSQRQRGRIREALIEAHRARDVVGLPQPRGAVAPAAVLEAQLLLEDGRPRASAALFDSISRWRLPDGEASAASRNRAWAMTHAANGLAAAGDTAGLAARADTVAAAGAGSFLGRDHRLYHHVRGLLLIARGRDAEAATELRAAIGSATIGYTRTELELARVLLRLRRPSDAVAVLQPALHGGLEGSGLYVNRTEMQEMLAQAWDAAGRRDSAAAHWAIVARDWADGDPPFAARAAAARARLGGR